MSSHLQGGEWRSSKKARHVIKVGSYVRFKVNVLQKQEAFYGISGSLLPKKTGCVEFLKAKTGVSDRDGGQEQC